MTERTSWRCVGCGGVHAPHVDTCPNQRLVGVIEWPAELRPVPDFPMTPDTMKIERRSASDHALDALADLERVMPNLAAAQRAGDHAAPCPTRYRQLMGEIDA